MHKEDSPPPDDFAGPMPPPLEEEAPPSYGDSVAAKPRRAASMAAADVLSDPLCAAAGPSRATTLGAQPAGRFRARARTQPAAVLEDRPLPQGWVRQFSPDHSRWYYVDTDANKGGGRSTWNHPLFDELYLSSLDPAERTCVEWDNKLFTLRQLGINVALASEPESVRDAREVLQHQGAVADSAEPVRGFRKMGRRLKDGMTKSTHAEREEKRKGKKKRHDIFVNAQARLSRAFAQSRETGIPQFVQQDVDGRDVVVLPPRPTPMAFEPMPPDPFASLLDDYRLKCIRMPNFEANGIQANGELQQQGTAVPVVTGLVGGLILGALLV